MLVKPDGVRRGLAGEVVGRLERKGYDLRGARLIRITMALARASRSQLQRKSRPWPWPPWSATTRGSGVLASYVSGT